MQEDTTLKQADTQGSKQADREASNQLRKSGHDQFSRWFTKKHQAAKKGTIQKTTDVSKASQLGHFKACVVRHMLEEMNMVLWKVLVPW